MLMTSCMWEILRLPLGPLSFFLSISLFKCSLPLNTWPSLICQLLVKVFSIINIVIMLPILKTALLMAPMGTLGLPSMLTYWGALFGLFPASDYEVIALIALISVRSIALCWSNISMTGLFKSLGRRSQDEIIRAGWGDGISMTAGGGACL